MFTGRFARNRKNNCGDNKDLKRASHRSFQFQSIVSIVKKKDSIDRCVKEALRLIGGIEKVVSKGDRVLIKPNLVCARSADTGTTTHLEIVRTVAEMCLYYGAKEVVIAESANWGIDTFSIFRKCGYLKLLENSNIKLADLKKNKLKTVQIEGGYVLKEIKLPQVYLESDVIINIPVLKVHNQTYVTLSLKNNALGICPDEEKRTKMHSIGPFFPPLSEKMMGKGSRLDYAIVDVNRVRKINVVVIDGIVGQEGMKAPLAGDPVGMELIVAGFDPVAVDSVGSSIMGYNPIKVPHIRLAQDAGMGEINLERIKLVGNSLAEVKRKFKSAVFTDLATICPKNFEINTGKTCYSCISAFSYFIMSHAQELKDMKLTVFIGKHPYSKPRHKNRELSLYFGNCAAENMYGGAFVPGCPPRSRRQVLQALGRLDFYTSYENVETFL